MTVWSVLHPTRRMRHLIWWLSCSTKKWLRRISSLCSSKKWTWIKNLVWGLWQWKHKEKSSGRYVAVWGGCNVWCASRGDNHLGTDIILLLLVDHLARCFRWWRLYLAISEPCDLRYNRAHNTSSRSRLFPVDSAFDKRQGLCFNRPADALQMRRWIWWLIPNVETRSGSKPKQTCSITALVLGFLTELRW